MDKTIIEARKQFSKLMNMSKQHAKKVSAYGVEER